MASYLATMVVGHYRIQQSTTAAGLPVVTAVQTSLPTSIDAQLARTPEIIDYESSVFGPYPFDAEGGIVVPPIIGFALENQTRPVYSAAFFLGGGDETWVIAHELAHQWYGDSVSVHDWSEIWLNEGFATYAEWLWSEHTGARSAKQIFQDTYAQTGDSFWQQPAGSPPKNQLFGDAPYTRGALTLGALRLTVGDDAFFKILKAWAAQKKDSTGTTPEFVSLASQISGQNLGQLFQNWLYGTSKPALPAT
jgi:aminopeptidase N